MQTLRLFYFSIIILSVLQANSQVYLNDVQTERIGQEKIQEFLVFQKENGINTFEDIKPSMQQNSNIKGYLIRENEYQVKRNLEDVWRHYLTTNPEKLWNGKRISFGFLFSKKEHKIFYCDEKISKIDTGMIVYLNLSLMSGLKNLATAFELISIDKENRIIEFSYLKGNVSVGKQRLQFYETSKGYTRILHTSFYKSNTLIKNYLLYPYFHTRTTHEFHRNNKKQILME